MIRSWLLAAGIVGGWLLAACGKSGNPSTDPARTVTSNTGQAGRSQAQPVQGSSAGASAQPFSLAGVFPPGPGRDLVLDTCGSCHPLGCSALGQRTVERWEAVKEGHKDKLTGRSTADVNTMFSYLKENFNDSRPEPKIPAEFVQQGCTPY